MARFSIRSRRGPGNLDAMRMPLTFRPKLHKTVELLVLLAHIAPDSSKYKAVKYIYLADVEHLNTRGRPITFDAYYALPSGPVAINALNLIEEDEATLDAAGLPALPFVTHKGIEGGKPTIFVGEPKRPFRSEHLSRSDVEIFTGIVEAHRHKSHAELKAETHDHEAYKRAWARRAPRTQKSLMDYAEMIPDGPYKDKLLDDLEPLAAFI